MKVGQCCKSTQPRDLKAVENELRMLLLGPHCRVLDGTMPLVARDRSFYLDDKKLQLFSGAVHYFRVVPEYWKDRLTRLKACGLNCVET